MVVAGRVLPDGDVAIMMVEAEATEKTDRARRRRRHRADRGGRRRRASRPPSRSSGRCATAQAELAAKAAKPVAEFPRLPRLPGRRLRRGRGRSVGDELAAGADRSPASRSARTRSTRSRTRSRPQLAGAVRGPREGDLRRVPLADQEAGPPARPARPGPHRRPRPDRHPAAVAPRSRSCRGCTARRCSSAARPRSWASPR